MRVLIACEESQTVCKAFRERGHEAYSCDLQACSGGHPEWHIMHDAVEVAYNGAWDLMIAHPPCTFLSKAGLHYINTRPGRKEMTLKSFEFVKKLWSAPIERIALENPVGWLNTNWRKPSQIIEPYYFGDPEKKQTCLWLKSLSRINGLLEVSADPIKFKPRPTSVGKSKKDGSPRNHYFCDRMKFEAKFDYKHAAKLKSKTFPGIARAMAEQWGNIS